MVWIFTGVCAVSYTHLDVYKRQVSLSKNPYQEEEEEIFAVAALLPQGYTRTLLPAIVDSGDPLPLLGYTAVGVDDSGQLMVAAVPTDEDGRWNPKYYNTPDLPERIAERQKEFPNNRMLEQLAKCSLEYGCFTAQNIFYRRFEAGLPVSPHCNAHCVGCISLQESQCCPSPQQRITAAPTVEEVAEVAAAHLAEAEYPIVSFGQGCEGEPSLQGDLIAAAIQEIRRRTKRGTINMNTNAGSTANLKKIVDAGINSLRVSMISAIPEHYAAYHRPENYTFADVKASLAYAQAHGVKLAINLLTYPGLNDRVNELEALVELVRTYGIAQIQIRNLNIDPADMTKLYGGEPSLGMIPMLQCLRENLPQTIIGSYSYPILWEE